MGRKDGRNDVAGITSLLVLGLGLVALFTGLSWFWMVFVIGFAVVVPIVAILTHDSEREPEPTALERRADRGEGESRTDAFRILRERYARGELSESQFEAKLDRLLGSETFEEVRIRWGEERERALER